jgi:cAMP-binding proteins - catabolite gene activator and regulatory subunit of cAMP-dependent protein kinases
MAVTGENLTFLKSVLPFWGKLTPEQQQKITAGAVPQKYHRGESMHRGSKHCAGLLLVKRGQLRVFIISENGKEITLYRLFDNDICIFSAACIMKNISFDVYVETEQETEALLVPTPLYNELNQSSIAVSDYTNQLMASRFSDVMWVLEQVLFSSFDRRLASFLLEQSAIDGTDRLAITHETIARHLGSAREVVTRMLRYFQSEGMVKLTRGGIALTDRKNLTELAQSQQK